MLNKNFKKIRKKSINNENRIYRYIDFLETEAAEKLTMQGTHQRKEPIKDVKKRFKPTSESTCVAGCNHQHPIFRCFKFRKLTVKERISLIKKARLCFLCFANHPMADCTFDACPTCGQKHNSMLCYQREKEFQNSLKNTAVARELTQKFLALTQNFLKYF